VVGEVGLEAEDVLDGSSRRVLRSATAPQERPEGCLVHLLNLQELGALTVDDKSPPPQASNQAATASSWDFSTPPATSWVMMRPWSPRGSMWNGTICGLLPRMPAVMT